MPGTPETRSAETILAFDFGRRRIGVAVGQTITASASPLGVISNNAPGADVEKIAVLIREWRPDRLIVGLPLRADGTPSELQHELDAFVARLKTFSLPIESVDERYTSLEAEAQLRQARALGHRGRISKQLIDSTAAVLIAERYLAGRSD